MNAILLLTAGFLLGNKEARITLEKALTPIINNAVSSIKPMVQNTIDSLNGKGNDTNVSEPSEQQPDTEQA